MYFDIDNALYVLVDVVNCTMAFVCENASMSVYLHDYDAMLHKSLGVVDIPNIKLLKKMLRSFIRIRASFIMKMMI